ncbi:MAG: hypothetical protein Q4F71_10780 [Paracoccus sp. (in: a-proteobacteria)]|nr:hypothetical protein [Paracoccus sp. (in: a-proteobacteria)]
MTAPRSQGARELWYELDRAIEYAKRLGASPAEMIAALRDKADVIEGAEKRQSARAEAPDTAQSANETRKPER